MAEQKTANKKAEVNVYQKVANIQQGIKTVVKSGFNAHFKYPFATERDIIAEIKPLLGREGLVITHSVTKEELVGDMTKLFIDFRITNLESPGDHIMASAVGYGKDTQDKGAPKAYTMALKYFLSKMFLVETGDDAEHGRADTKGKAVAPTETAEQKFERAKRMISESRNIDGLMEYASQVKNSKNFSAAQKAELNTLLNARVQKLNEQA